MKTWFKGGLIGGGIGIVYLIIHILISFGCPDNCSEIRWQISRLIISPFSNQCFSNDPIGCIYLSFVLVILEFFILGAIIGFLVGKFRKK